MKRKLLFHDHAVCLKTFSIFSTIIVQWASQTRVTGNQPSANGRGDSLWSDFEWLNETLSFFFPETVCTISNNNPKFVPIILIVKTCNKRTIHFSLTCHTRIDKANIVDTHLCDLFLYFYFLSIFIKVFLVQFIGPVLKSLSYNRWHSKVIISTTTSNTFGNEVISPTTLISSTVFPSVNLSSIIFCAPPKVKSTIPTKETNSELFLHY